MANLATYCFTAALITMSVAAGCYLFHLVSRLRVRATQLQTTAGTTTGATVTVGGATGPADSEAGRFGGLLTWLAFAFLIAWLVFRWSVTGHAPYSNQFEFATAFTLGMTGVFLFFQQRYQVRTLGALVVPAAVLMLVYANSLPDRILPLIPALQSPLLTIHVAMAVIAYGTFATAAAAAALYLLNERGQIAWLPKPAACDEIAYKAVIIGFPAQALLLMLGALWASIAWGRYWGWDPKETAALVTWLIYAGYLHARVLRGWQGRGAAILLLLGFAAVLFTFTGNHFLGGLHAYGGL
ncbi:MAG: c-type cytochrome biogenesis protein CcsB [Chloroflexi bacterium]|nr:c-type cytochrome biogenesis protein CcsB [Chloroflexota bacterium]